MITLNPTQEQIDAVNRDMEFDTEMEIIEAHGLDVVLAVLTKTRGIEAAQEYVFWVFADKKQRAAKDEAQRNKQWAHKDAMDALTANDECGI